MVDVSDAVVKHLGDFLKGAELDPGDYDLYDEAQEILDVIERTERADKGDVEQEVAAMQAIVKALEGLSSGAASRVLQWAESRFSGEGYY